MLKVDHRKAFFQRFMILVAIIESSFLFLQAAKGFRTKSTEDIDISSMAIVFFVSITWFYYGYAIMKDRALMLSGTLNSIGSTLVLVTIFLYGDQ